MKITVDAKTLAGALRIANSCIEAKAIKPILRDVLIDASNGAAIVSATDLEVSASLPIKDASIGKQGRAVLPGEILAGIANESEGEMSLSWNGNAVCAIKTNRGAYKMLGVEAEEFPIVPREIEGEAVSVDGAKLAEAFSLAIPFAAQEKQRYALNAVCLEVADGKVKIVATDGRRLCIIPAGETGKGEFTALIPTKAAKVFTKTAGADATAIAVKERAITIAADSTVITAQLVDGRFPPYQDVIPDEGTEIATLSLDAEEFAATIRAASIMSEKEVRAVSLSCKGDMLNGDTLAISASGADKGDGDLHCACEFDGEAFEGLRINPDYLLDAIKVCGATVCVGIYGTSRAVVLTGGDRFALTGIGRLALVMPISE